jgi:hypothetical protein
MEIINFLQSIPSPLSLPFFSFCGISIYLTIKLCQKTEEICRYNVFGTRVFKNEEESEKYEASQKGSEVKICVIKMLIKGFFLTGIVFRCAIKAFGFYAFLFVINCCIIFYLPSLIFPSECVYNIYSINALFLINAILFIYGMSQTQATEW